MSKRDLFPKILFSTSISISLVLFDILIGTNHVLPFRAKVNLRALAKKGYSVFPKAQSLPYLPNPSAREGYDTRSIFKRSLTGLNSEFSFS